MVDSSQIREYLAKYLHGELSLQEFEDWFVPATWDLHKANDPEAENLADDIEMALSEYTSGHHSAEKRRQALAVAIPAAPSRAWRLHCRPLM